MGLTDEQAFGAVRITLSKENTKEEIDYTIGQIKESVWELRQKSELWLNKSKNFDMI